MAEAKLHLDADTAVRALAKSLRERGLDITRTPTGWMPFDASDEMQLLCATARGRILFTFNIRDFVALAKQHPRHAGIVLAAQRTWSISSMITALDTLLSETTDEEWIGQVRWLNEWKP